MKALVTLAQSGVNVSCPGEAVADGDAEVAELVDLLDFFVTDVHRMVSVSFSEVYYKFFCFFDIQM